MALRYFLKHNSLGVADFHTCMMSLSYDTNRLFFGVELMEHFFQMQGGRHLSELQMLILLEQSQCELVVQGQMLQEGMSDAVLKALLGIYGAVVRDGISTTQLMSILRVNGSGFINREELTDIVLKLDSTVSVIELCKYLDPHQ